MLDYIFIDETGEPGPSGSAHFGFGLLHVHSDNYKVITQLMAQVRWLCNIFSEIKRTEPGQEYRAERYILKGLQSLMAERTVFVSGFFINKEQYRGRYLRWCERPEVSEDDWAYYLRNYLLRHLLEFHFSYHELNARNIDIVVDRITLSESQRLNTLNYLTSKVTLKEPFKLPNIQYFTIGDSKYICGLEVAHIIAGLVREQTLEAVKDSFCGFASFVPVIGFLGHMQDQLLEGGKDHPLGDPRPLD